MGVFFLVILEGIDIGSFVGSFDGTDGTGDDVDGPFVGLGVGGGLNSSDIYAMQFNYSSHVPCKS